MNNPVVFTDFHHAGLLNSLILLFEKRLGGQLYRPIGKDWYEKGFWKIYDHPATVEQYLGIGGATPDGTPKLNEVTGIAYYVGDPIIYYCKDIDSGQTNRAITFEGFMNTPFDIVIASVPQHIEPFKKLCEIHPSHPKLIFQIGNAWSAEAGGAKNIMASAKVDFPPGTNGIIYHQEFDLNTFSYKLKEKEKKIYSFQNCLGTTELYKPDWELFLALEKLMPDWEFRSYGGQCRDGWCNGTKELAEKMHEATFGFMCKTNGDGYGHVIHNLAATGTPLITRLADYRGKLAEPLIVDALTSLTVDNRTPEEIAEIIEADYQTLNTLSLNIYRKFKEVVSFDAEEVEIREFLDRLI